MKFILNAANKKNKNMLTESTIERTPATLSGAFLMLYFETERVLPCQDKTTDILHRYQW